MLLCNPIIITRITAGEGSIIFWTEESCGEAKCLCLEKTFGVPLTQLSTQCDYVRANALYWQNAYTQTARLACVQSYSCPVLLLSLSSSKMPPEVRGNKRAFFDISINGEPAGRIVFSLWNHCCEFFIWKCGF